MDVRNGLKNLNLVDCVIPRTFNGKKVYGLAYRCFHSAPNIVKVFIPKTSTIFIGDSFANCKQIKEIFFEDGFHNVNLSSYTLIGASITSFRFPIGSSIGDFFFAESKIQDIYIYDFMSFNTKETFDKCLQAINIYVPVNYPYNSFGGKSVKKILPNYIQNVESKAFQFCCLYNHLSSALPFIFLFV